MKQWKYITIKIAFDTGKEPNEASINKELVEAGSYGWELVSTSSLTINSKSYLFLFMKHEVEDKEASKTRSLSGKDGSKDEDAYKKAMERFYNL